MLKAKLGDRIDGWIEAAVPFLFRRRIDPNVLTVLGALVSLAAAAAFVPGWFVAGGLLIVFGGLFDLVDGVVARHHGVSTRFGAFLDSTLDRFGEVALLLGIALHYALRGEAGHVLLAGTALAASVLVSYLQARAELEGSKLRVGILERAERLGILAAGAVFGLMVPALWVLAVGGAFTVIQRFAEACRQILRLDAGEPPTLSERA